MNFHSDLERLVFEKIASKYEESGYEFIEPSGVKIPSGEWRYEPDFLARKGEEFVAIEVKARRTVGAERSLEKLRQQIEQNDHWKFVVLYANEEISQRFVKKVGVDAIAKTLDEVRATSKLGSVKAAFLLAWGGFEAAARIKHSRFFAKPQSPGRIITVLAERGELAPDVANRLRKLARNRNDLIHGGLDVDVTSDDVHFVSDIAANLTAINLE